MLDIIFNKHTAADESIKELMRYPKKQKIHKNHMSFCGNTDKKEEKML